MNRLISWKSLAATALIVASLSSAAAVTGIHAASTGATANGNGGGVQQQGGAPVNSITVNGFGQASGKPDVAMVQLGVEVFDADPSKAIASANEIIAKVTKAVAEVGVAEGDIQTQNFNLYSTGNPPQPPMSEPSTSSSSAQQQRMYQAQISVSVKVRDISKAGAVIDAGLKAGANNIYGLNFNVDDPTKLESEARVKAIANARARAEELAKALGVTLGDPIIISEGVSGGGPIAYGGAMGMGGADSKISEGQLALSVNVQITYAISK